MDLIPIVGLVYIAPYRMTLSILVELKKQVEKLLEKQFIRTNIWQSCVIGKEERWFPLCIDYR